MPPINGTYLARMRWFNKMNGRQFDEWRMMSFYGGKWQVFDGAEIVEWQQLPK